LRVSRAVLGEDPVSELANAGANIAQDVFIGPGQQFNTARISSEGSPDRKGEPVDKRVYRLVAAEGFPARRHQRLANFGAHGQVVERGGQRTARSPETDQHCTGLPLRYPWSVAPRARRPQWRRLARPGRSG